MPINRNALIRYRTINQLLSTGRWYTIYELLDACNEALRDFCGGDTSVSERTIRDDIRVMRSDILGFRAPIGVKDGLYYYSNRNYSLQNVLITDQGLIEELLGLFQDLKQNKIDLARIDEMMKQLGDTLSRARSFKDIHHKDVKWSRLDNMPEGLMQYITMPKETINWLTWGEALKFF